MPLIYIDKIKHDTDVFRLRDTTLFSANSTNSKIHLSFLPSYVDDVLEYSSVNNFPSTGETGKIYVDTTSNKVYRWSGSTYIAISSNGDGTVTSVRVQGTSPIVSSQNTAQTTTLNTTISLAAAGPNTVLAGPSTGTTNAAPTYRKLIAADTPDVLPLTGGTVTGPVTFGDSVSIDDLSVGTLSTTGNATFTNNISANTINGVAVGSTPKFTDTVTTVTTAGSGNAITSITASNGIITATKGSTFLTSAPVTSVNGQTGAVNLNIPTVPTNVSAFINDAGYTTNTGTVTGVKINGSTKNPTSGVVDLGTFATSDTNTTYSLSNALSSHKFTSTLTAGGSGSGTSTATIELAAGTGITLTDDTTNKKITIASSVTNTDTKVQIAEVTSGTTYYPLVGTGTTAATRQYDTTGLIYKGTNGTTSAVGYSTLTLGNNKASGTANNKQGQLVIYGSTAYSHTIQGAPTANRTLTLPNATGTIALTSDIPSVPSAGTTATAVGTSSNGGSATTWSKSDHVHSITSSTITTALGYTPYNSTNPNGYTSNVGTVTGVKINGSTKNPTSGVVDLGTFATSDTNTTYTLSNALSSHKFTSTLTAGGSGSGTSTATMELAAGSGISLTDDTTNKKITVAVGTVGLDHGGTGATTAAAARTNLGLGSAATYTAAASVGNNSNLPTGAAIQSYVTGLGYITDPGVSKITTAAGAHTAISNATGAVSFNIPTKTSHLTNDSGYEANQNAFSNIKVSSTTIAADAKTDTLEMAAGTGIALTPDATNDKVTITHGATGTGTAQTTQALYPITYDAQGHITGAGNAVSLAATTFDITYDADTGNDADTVDSAGKAIFNFNSNTSRKVDEVTQTLLSTSDTKEYPLLISSSTNTASSITDVTQKSDTLTFIRNDDGISSLKIGGSVILNRFHFYSDETTANEGIGIGIGTMNNSQSELFYRTAGSGLFGMYHWSAAKNADGSIPSNVYRDSIITMSTAANNPTIYLYNKSGANTITSYSRLNASGLYINDGSAHVLSAASIDRINALGSSYKFNQYTAYTSAIAASTWFKFTNFTLSAGTYLIICSARFASTNTEGVRIFRLSTTNALSNSVTSPVRASTFSEVTMGAHSSSQNYMNFSIILTPTTSTTYYLWGWSSVAASAHSSNNSCDYSYFRLL